MAVSGRNRIRVLIVSEEAPDRERYARAAEHANEELELTRVAAIDDAVEANGTGAFDVLLLDLEPADRRGLVSFVRLQEAVPALPIVVTASRDHEAMALKAVQLGALDYLIEDSIHPTLLERCLRFAVERNRALMEIERRARAWEREWEGQGTTGNTARSFGSVALRQSAPPLFEELVDRYVAALEAAVEERVYRIDETASGQLRQMAEQLGFLRAGPRDVIDVHTTGLRRIEQTRPSHRFASYLDTSRTTVLEVMGHLVTHYRRYSLGVTPLDAARPRIIEPIERRRT